MSASSTLRSLVLASAVFAAACTTVGPDHVPPTLELAPGWRQPATAGLARDTVDERPFWLAFGDPVLDSLVERALTQNLDLRAAWARLQAARALRGAAAADRWPSLDTRATYEHREDSKNTPFGAFIPVTDIHTVAADAAWEIDLWGRVRRSIEAADGELQANEADLQSAMLTVATEVVATYVDLRASQRRLQIADANLALQDRTLGLVRSRFAAGLVGERDVAQAATNVESTRARLPQLQAQTTAAQHRLAVLLGRAPGELGIELGATAALPVLPARIAVGAPADLLRRRPDVRAAERRLAAEVARIGVAEADRYPRLSLGGTLGLSANSAGKVFEADSDVVAFGPSLRWNLFDGGRLRQRIAALTANAEAAQIAWEQTVLRALEEAENAMTRFVHEQERRGSLQRAAAEARRAVALAQSQYRAGLSDFQTVIDSERTVAAIEDDLVGSEAAVTGNLVAIWKAIGGGLPPAPATPPASSAPSRARPAD